VWNETVPAREFAAAHPFVGVPGITPSIPERVERRSGTNPTQESTDGLRARIRRGSAGGKQGELSQTRRGRAKLFREFGATRIVEAWGEDVPDGKVTDFKRAVQAKAGEVVVFGWQEFPSKAVADAAFDKMMNDPRMKELGAIPFDGQRMIFGGFSTLVDEGTKR
jgi:uncharacterized protein YbaA (DUF1428 family)